MKKIIVGLFKQFFLDSYSFHNFYAYDLVQVIPSFMWMIEYKLF